MRNCANDISLSELRIFNVNQARPLVTRIKKSTWGKSALQSSLEGKKRDARNENGTVVRALDAEQTHLFPSIFILRPYNINTAWVMSSFNSSFTKESNLLSVRTTKAIHLSKFIWFNWTDLLRFVTVSLWPETEIQHIHPGFHCFKNKTLIVLSPFDMSECGLGGECR